MFEPFDVLVCLAGGVACVRDRRGGREGECPGGTLFKASSDAQGEEGMYDMSSS